MNGRKHVWAWRLACGPGFSRPAALEHAIARLREVRRNWREYLPIVSMSLPTILILAAAVITISVGA